LLGETSLYLRLAPKAQQPVNAQAKGDLHIAGGGKMVDFAGYSLPVHYGSLVDEHHSVRQSAGMFDVSHMCIVDVHGDSAQNWLRSLLTNDVAKLGHNKRIWPGLKNI